MKKEVSDHLAKVFLETKAPQKKKRDRSFVYFIALSLVLLAGFIFSSTFLSNVSSRGLSATGESVKLELHDGPYSLKFDFSKSPSSLSTLNIEMPDLDFSDFKSLSFLIRLQKADTQRLGTLKVSLVNRRKETSSRYFSEINSKWKKIVVPFTAFGSIRDLSAPVTLSFTLEPWNLYPKKGELLIDDIQFFKN